MLLLHLFWHPGEFASYFFHWFEKAALLKNLIGLCQAFFRLFETFEHKIGGAKKFERAANFDAVTPAGLSLELLNLV